MKYDVIIVGAGAAGLVAAKELLSAGHKICLLEANGVAGGRISTLTEGFNSPAEAGAEFVHGPLPVTLQLLKEANIPYYPIADKMVTVQQGEWLEEEEQDNQWEKFTKALNKLDSDMTIRQFLDKYFADAEFIRLRESIQRFSEGFDLADTTRASILSLKKEWSRMEETQYRIEGGYMQLINWMVDNYHKKGATIYFNSCVQKIEYNAGGVTVYTNEGQLFQASKIIITVPVGVLKSGAIEFIPALTTHAAAIEQIGFGSVIKVLLEFSTAFWKQRDPDAGFILSDEKIPTWWTQLPVESRLLTGWLGGPEAMAKSSLSDEQLLQIAIGSLASIFRESPVSLQKQLVYHQIVCWHNHPYAKGGYSYATTGSAAAKQIMNQPVDGVIFFAGEAVSQGESLGTVEAALESGIAVVKKIIG